MGARHEWSPGARAARPTRRRLRVVRGGGRGSAQRDPQAAAASLVLPGLGQLAQGRTRAALAHVVIASVLCAACVARVPSRRVALALLVVWSVCSAVDAARHRARPALRRV